MLPRSVNCRERGQHLTRRYRRMDCTTKRTRMRVYQIVRRAVLRGILTKPDCCVFAHHDDYTKPLDVRWLCHACHDALTVHLGRPRKPKPLPRPRRVPKPVAPMSARFKVCNSVVDIVLAHPNGGIAMAARRCGISESRARTSIVRYAHTHGMLLRDFLRSIGSKK